MSTLCRYWNNFPFKGRNGVSQWQQRCQKLSKKGNFVSLPLTWAYMRASENKFSLSGNSEWRRTEWLRRCGLLLRWQWVGSTHGAETGLNDGHYQHDGLA